MQPATIIVKQAPIKVSSRPHLRSEKRSRLSATQLCWKKSCQGAIVVPTIAMTTKTRFAVIPPTGTVGTKVRPHTPISSRPPATSGLDQRFPVVVLAASTGGPATVMRIAPGFTRDFPAAVILVQHMPAAFTTQYAVQLAEFTEIRVKEAEANESLLPGTFYICPGGQHLRVTPTGRIQLDGTSGRIDGYLPNIDVTMESVAAYAGALSIAGVLTGMGSDGAKGAKAIKAAGGMVLAQDEATSVIFGMPAEVIKAGVVDHVLGIDDIYAAIEKRVLGICRLAPAGVR